MSVSDFGKCEGSDAWCWFEINTGWYGENGRQTRFYEVWKRCAPSASFGPWSDRNCLFVYYSRHTRCPKQPWRLRFGPIAPACRGGCLLSCYTTCEVCGFVIDYWDGCECDEDK